MNPSETNSVFRVYPLNVLRIPMIFQNLVVANQIYLENERYTGIWMSLFKYFRTDLFVRKRYGDTKYFFLKSSLNGGIDFWNDSSLQKKNSTNKENISFRLFILDILAPIGMSPWEGGAHVALLQNAAGALWSLHNPQNYKPSKCAPQSFEAMQHMPRFVIET